ncbi:MAG: cell division protein FtsK, partial [Actinomycetota bacterium]|nr:cell division protein FtsK [Actinomycetota bacterium]
MAGRTTAKTTRARGAGPGSRSRGARSSRSSRPATRRPSSRSRLGSRLGRGALGRGLGVAGGLLARGVASLARSVGRTRELDPAHRRDGVALVLIAVAVVAAAGVWWNAGGPVGTGVERGLRAVIGSAAVLL